MNRFRKIPLFMLSFLVLMSVPKAATCSYEEKAKLNNEVANVKTNYEIKERVLNKDEYDVPDGIENEEFIAKTDYVQVNILNLTNNLYAEVTNNINDEVKIFNYTDTKDGNISFNWNELDTIVTYTVKIYSSSNTNCEGTALKTLYVSLPRYNDYSTYEVCKEVPDYYLCQRYVTFESVGYDTFFTRVREQIAKSEQIKEEENKKNNKWYKKTIDFIVEHKVPFIIGGVTLVVVAGGATFIIIKKRRRSIIWKRKD